MSSATPSPPSAPPPESELTDAGMYQAVRARALHQIEQEHSRPPMSLKRRLLLLALTAIAVSVVVLLINWVVSGLFRIMDIWYPGSISGHYQSQSASSAPAPISADQPFIITVVPDTSQSSSQTSETKQSATPE